MIVASHVPVSPDPTGGSRAVEHDDDHRRRRRSLDRQDGSENENENGRRNGHHDSTVTPRGGNINVDGGDGVGCPSDGDGGAALMPTSVRASTGGGGGGGDWSSRKKGASRDMASAAAAPASAYPRETHPPFPLPGSLLSSRYFVLSRLGRGTFCSIHKCVDLSARHGCTGGADDDMDDPIVAAKIELSSFANSGVLDGEAQVLRHLHKAAEPRGEIVPRFVEYLKDVPAVISTAAISGATAGEEDEDALLRKFKCGGRDGDVDGSISAIVMQYLPGEDMARLRDRYHTAQKQLDPSSTRRLHPNDAVYLCADVMLPLLRSMHRSGVIHRDVKPSNVVRVGSSPDSRRFRIVDFGLSKSFVVPRSSAVADTSLPWDGTWDDGTDRTNGRHQNLPPPGCQRRERERADFRGTSMYASPRVHALRDYCRRDDVWSLMYAFCDFVSGGLPWTQFALNRDREGCGRSKDRVHAEGNANVAELLFGPAYHRYVRPPPQSEQEGDAEDSARREALKLNMARDERKVGLLREAFNHLGGLEFGDEPDYDLLERCMVGFVEDERGDGHGASSSDRDPELPRLDWNIPAEKRPDEQEEATKSSRKRKRDRNGGGDHRDGKRRRPPPPSFTCWTDPIADEVDAHLLHQLRVAKVEYNARRYGTTPESSPRTAPRQHEGGDDPPSKPELLTDWLSAAIPLVYEPWDVARHEKWGESRNEDDGYRREGYVATLRRCLDAAEPFGRFMDREYHRVKVGAVDLDGNDGAAADRLGVRRMEETVRARVGLRSCIAREMAKPFAPPPAISFSG